MYVCIMYVCMYGLFDMRSAASSAGMQRLASEHQRRRSQRRSNAIQTARSLQAGLASNTEDSYLFGLGAGASQQHQQQQQ